MNSKLFTVWFLAVSGILVMFGIIYAFVGLQILPV